jgi:hypothetical protein
MTSTIDPVCNDPNCSHKASIHRFGKDFCLAKGCDCMVFKKSGIPNILK